MGVAFGGSQVGLPHCGVPEQRNLLERSVTFPRSRPMVVCSCSSTAELRGVTGDPKTSLHSFGHAVFS